MEMKGRVCVTGGTGFIASWLIKRLLEDGYSVNTTIRPSRSPARYDDIWKSLPDRKDISYLTDLPSASERLEIFNADLNEPESFDPAIEGCVGVFHVAHPTAFESKETVEVTIKRAVSGTTRILQACLNSKTLERVVYTSSVSTVYFNDKELDVLLDETVWSDVDYIRTKFDGHAYANYGITKIFTEKAALEFAEANSLDLVSIIPTRVLGPFICPYVPGSVWTSMAMILRHPEHYKFLFRTCFVHTDDLARAHIFLLQNPNAKGRYICSAADLRIEKLAKCLSDRYPEYPIPTAETLKDVTGYASSGVSSKKLLDLGFKYSHGIEEMFDGAVECCKQKGFL